MMKYIFTIFFLLITLSSKAQLTTMGVTSVNDAVQNVLLGEGVEVYNVNYFGSQNAIGTFNSANANVGFESGLILTTGTIFGNASGPIGPNNSGQSGMDNGSPQYMPLTNIVGTQTYNASVLEFDFIPYSDTVRFRYVFASEEYPEYVGSTFNDVFAFFISGPGIPGGTTNMAIIPGTVQEVTINNVNDNGPNSIFFVDNGDGNQAPYNQSPQYIQYDGFTVPLTAWSKVQCGEVYHLVLAIADVQDAFWDSGIFLEANSLESPQPIQVEYELSSDPYGDGQSMAQNCSSAEVTLTRSGANSNLNEALSIEVNVSGTAIEGTDYTNIPNTIDFAPGQTTVSFTIDALLNPNLTGTANLIINFLISSACGEDESQSIELFIRPVEPVAVTVNDTVKFCVNDTVSLIANAQGGGGGYTYLWSTGETTESILVNPATTQTYSVTVTDNCLNESATASATVTVPPYEPLSIASFGDTAVDCPYTLVPIWVTASGASHDYNFQWVNSAGGTSGTDSLIHVFPGYSTTYTVFVTERCGEIDSAQVTVDILNPPLTASIFSDSVICKGDSVLMMASAVDGFGDYHFFWPHSGDTTNQSWVTPNESGSYNVIVTDDCNTYQRDASTYINVLAPLADFEVVSTPLFINLPVTFENTSVGAQNYWWNFGNGSTSFQVHPNSVYPSPGVYDITLVATDFNGCVDTVVKPLLIVEEVYLYVPNSFTPNDADFNNTFMASTIGIDQMFIQIFDRWGELIFESNDIRFQWDGTYKGKPVPDGTYVWKMEYSTIHSDETELIMGHINVLR